MNPFDLKSALLARHAQHVVLIHFPIALFITSVAFDGMALWKGSRTLADAAYYNLLAAAVSALPAVATGLLAWQTQLDGAKLRGNLRLHLVLALLSSVAIWLVWWQHFRARRTQRQGAPAIRLAAELATVVLVALTAHVGGFVSGVNGSG
jgi:uncharacterized membrane protein